LYLSEYFEKRRALYEDGLTLVREKGDVERWLIFFLEGVVATAKNSVETFKAIMTLRARYDAIILALGSKAQKGHTLLLHLFSAPIIDVKTAANVCGVTFNTANTLLLELTGKKVLREMTGSSRNRLFALYEYLDLFR
jgi:Fic family protein